jgi:hypothetical protein
MARIAEAMKLALMLLSLTAGTCAVIQTIDLMNTATSVMLQNLR